MPFLREAQKNTWGGWSTAYFTASGQSNMTTVSGIGDFLLQSGPGRLDLFLPGTPGLSGFLTLFYDANPAASGGPYVLSGHKPLFGYQAPNHAQSGFMPQGSLILGMPFQSGLCVRWLANSGAGGSPAFTVCWTPEPPQNF